MTRLLYDPHTHTDWSHGKDSIRAMVEAADRKGLEGIHITEHGMSHWTARKIGMEGYEAMRREIDALQASHQRMRILFGTEANVLSLDGDIDFTAAQMRVFDVVNVGFHLMARMRGRSSYSRLLIPALVRHRLGISSGGERLRADCTAALTAAVERWPVRMITHPGSRFPIDLEAVARVCAARGTLLEINSPRRVLTARDVAAAAGLGACFEVASDAHSARDVGEVSAALEIAVASGVPLSRFKNIL